MISVHNDGFDSKDRKRVQLDGEDITILKQNGKYFAFESKCPHKGGPLFLCRTLSDDRIMCPSHHIIFNLNNGDVLENPIPKTMGDYANCSKLKTYEVKINGQELEIIV